MKIFSPWVISLSMDVIALPMSFAREEYPFDKKYSGNYCGLEGELSDRSVEFWTRDCGVGSNPDLVVDFLSDSFNSYVISSLPSLALFISSFLGQSCSRAGLSHR